MSCGCETIGASGVRFCDEHHRYWRGDAELASVTRVVKEAWPYKPDFSAADPEVLENARGRGVEVDRLFCQWLEGKLPSIPAGTREDSKDLFMKLLRWWPTSKLERTCVATQVLLADAEIAGTADIVGEGIAELKTVSAIEPTYRLQLGGYCHLYEVQHGKLPKWCGIIHVNKSLREPKWIPFEPEVVVAEFFTVLEMWRLVRRLKPRKFAGIETG